MTLRVDAIRYGLGVLAIACSSCLPLYAAQHITLRNGFEIDCVRSETAGNRVRLYFSQSDGTANYLEVAATAIVRVETADDPPQLPTLPKTPASIADAQVLTKAEMRELLTHAGSIHHIDVDLLASVMKAESGGNIRAVSKAGAQGLMQLMPGTASEMGVQDAFRPDQNIAGGTAYLDELLSRYHDNISLALAAYNAGPGAVDRYHGVPPYRETRVYVARVIREFNRRKQMALTAQAR